MKESDIEMLVQKSVEVLEKEHVEVGKPKFTKSWDDIIDEETELIKKALKN